MIFSSCKENKEMIVFKSFRSRFIVSTGTIVKSSWRLAVERLANAVAVYILYVLYCSSKRHFLNRPGICFYQYFLFKIFSFITSVPKRCAKDSRVSFVDFNNKIIKSYQHLLRCRTYRRRNHRLEIDRIFSISPTRMNGTDELFYVVLSRIRNKKHSCNNILNRHVRMKTKTDLNASVNLSISDSWWSYKNNEDGCGSVFKTIPSNLRRSF